MDGLCRRPSPTLVGGEGASKLRCRLMLLTLRYPMVDLRQFCQADYDQSIKLPPTWTEDHDFVRSFGPVTRRQLGPVDQWPTERIFGRFDQVLRFPVGFPVILTESVGGVINFYGINRRLFPATERDDLFHLDVQIAGSSWAFPPGERPEWTLSRSGLGSTYGDPTFNLLKFLKGLLDTPVVVHGPGNATKSAPLRKAGTLVADSFESATMTRPSENAVVIGKPAIVLEFMDHEDPGQAWNLRNKIGHGLTLSAQPKGAPQADAQVWMISRRERRNRSSRELRIHLLRLHSEREFLRQLCGLLRRAGFVNALDEVRSDRLQESIADSLQLLTKRERYGFDTIDLMQAAFAADRVVSTQEHDVLALRVRGMRRSIAKRLEALRTIEDQAMKSPPRGTFPIGE
jgi:hypothetical protein